MEEEAELEQAAARWNRVKCFASRLFIEDMSTRCQAAGEGGVMEEGTRQQPRVNACCRRVREVWHCLPVTRLDVRCA